MQPNIHTYESSMYTPIYDVYILQQATSAELWNVHMSAGLHICQAP